MSPALRLPARKWNTSRAERRQRACLRQAWRRQRENMYPSSSHFVYLPWLLCARGLNSLGTLPSIEQNSANWYLRFLSLWALSPGSRGRHCLVGPNCKQLSLWSAPADLTLFELCFPLAFWEPFALFLCVEKRKKKRLCFFIHFLKSGVYVPSCKPKHTQSHTQTHFPPLHPVDAFRAVMSVLGRRFFLFFLFFFKGPPTRTQFVNNFGRHEPISVGSP